MGRREIGGSVDWVCDRSVGNGTTGVWWKKGDWGDDDGTTKVWRKNGDLGDDDGAIDVWPNSDDIGITIHLT